VTVLFDAATGRLRLSADDWEALLSWSRDHSRQGEHLTRLREAGVIRGDWPHSSVMPALEAALDHITTLRVRQRLHDGRRIDGTGLVARGAVAFLLDAPDDLRELLTVHPTMLTSALARVVALGPRDRGEIEDREAAADAETDLFGSDAGRRRAAADAIGGLPGVDGPWNYWSVHAHRQPDGLEEGLTVLDTPDQMWLVERTREKLLLSPTDPTRVWRLLIRISSHAMELFR